MNENQLTSSPLSKWLAERGFKRPSELAWNDLLFKDESKRYVLGTPAHPVLTKSYPAYDLLWDICIKHAKEIFGEENTEQPPNHPNYFAFIFHPREVMALLFHGYKEEAEKYIMENSILEPTKQSEATHRALYKLICNDTTK